MKNKSFSISGTEMARIEQTDETTRFLICASDICMREVTYKEFKEFIISISYVCLTSCNKDIQQSYIEFVQYFDKL